MRQFTWFYLNNEHKTYSKDMSISLCPCDTSISINGLGEQNKTIGPP